MKSKIIAVLQALKAYEDKNENRPTLQELAWAIGYEHASSVVSDLNMLERHGYVTRELRKARSLRTTEAGREFLQGVEQ